MTTLNGNVAAQPTALLGVEHLHTLTTAMTVAFDTETTGLQPEEGGLRLLQLGARNCPIVLIDCWELDLAGWAAVRDFFEAKQRFWLAHNAVFDLGWLQEHGIRPNGQVMCSMIASKLLSNGVPNLKHGLAPTVERYLDRTLSKELQVSDWSAPVLSAEQLAYAAGDVQALLDLDLVLNQRLGAARLMKAFALECAALPAMAQMWRTGLPFSRTKLEELQASLEADIERYGEQFVADLDAALPEEHKLPRDEDGSFNLRSKAEGAVRLGTKRQAGFNLNSPKQLVEKFTVLLGVVPVGKEGKPSAARDALRDYAADHKVIQIYLLWKRAEKRRQMVISLLEHQAPDGFIRASYMQLGADTGRMSCIAEGQKITIPGGYKNIEDIEIGDYVYALNETGAPVVRKVTNVWCNGLRDTVRVTWIAAGNRDPLHGEVVCTPEHRIKTSTGWVEAADLLTGQRIWHLRRGVERRPRLYAPNYCHQEQLLLKKEVFQANGEAYHIHHKDHNPSNNTLDNLVLMCAKEHAKEHARNPVWLNTPEVRQKGLETSIARGIWPREGAKHPGWIVPNKYMLLRLLANARGKLTAVPMDFDTYKRKCVAVGIDLDEGASRYTKDGVYLSKACVQAALQQCKTRQRACEKLKIGTRKLNALLLSYGIVPTNHKVHSVTPAGTARVFDIEVEGEHNFIAGEICVHNCSKPNLQQIPRDNAFRLAAEAPEGWTFVCADFGQMELRLAAAQAEDETMIEAFKNDMDLHTLTASAIYTEPTEDEKELKLRRQVAKSANFGLLFGAGAKGLRNYAGAMGITMTIEEAEAVRDTFHSTYKGINKWQRDNAITSDSTRGDKWAEVRIPVSGMRRFLPGDMNRVTVRCNTPVQGAGAAVMKAALGKLWLLLTAVGEHTARLSAVVHDEVLLLVREGTEAQWMSALQGVMEDAEAEWLGDIPPLAEANSGKTWAEAK